MKHSWLIGALLTLACSGGTEGNGKSTAPLDECGDGDRAACELNGAPGTKSCEVAENGFAWGKCEVRDASRDTCSEGEVMHCFAEGSPTREEFGDMTAPCELIDGRFTYNPNRCTTPLVLSFDGAPVELVKAAGEFDLFGQGMSIGTDWVSAKTPWLVLDRDRDGTIVDGSELFGSMTVLSNGSRATNGFEALAALDANGDGWITAQDPAFAELRLWSDNDQDRRSSRDELQSLSSQRVEGIELSHRVVPRCSPGGCELERARIRLRDATGVVREGAVIDVHLRGY